jgi:type II secretory pathway component PulF
MLRLPLLGVVVRKQAVVRLATVIAALMQSGITFEKAIHTAQRAMPNVVLREALGQCELAVQAGRNIAEALSGTRAFPPTVIQVFAVGQASGRLEEMLERLAKDYDVQVQTATQRFTAILEPALILVMVLIVGLIAFATILPMLEATRALQ